MDFRLPELGEGVYEAELVEWKVRPGDFVKPAQTLAEVMTDKAVMDLPSPFEGTVAHLAATAGSIVKVGDVILQYDGAAVTSDVRSESPGKPAPSDRPADDSGATKPPRPSPSSSSSASARPAASPKTPVATTVPRSDGNGNGHSVGTPRIPASPSVRRMAQRLGIDLENVRGSGPGGRILIDDLPTHVPASPFDPAVPPPPKRPPSDWGTPGTRIRFVGMRRKIAERMVHSANTIPHYAYIDECEVTDLVRLRESLRESLAKSGARLTYLAFFVRAAVTALREVPLVNSSLDEAAGEIALHDGYHIGIATATPRGLVVPVIRDADRLSILDVAREIDRLGNEARSGRLRPDDLGGSTFTITSIGSIGGLIATPVINHPEVAIMGIGRIIKRPVYDAAGQIRPADMVYLSFSFDHRVIDGAVGAEFGNAVIRALRSPAAMLLPPQVG